MCDACCTWEYACGCEVHMLVLGYLAQRVANPHCFLSCPCQQQEEEEELLHVQATKATGKAPKKVGKFERIKRFVQVCAHATHVVLTC